jgi:predicted anti-sigma-YlaC factor YlaD
MSDLQSIAALSQRQWDLIEEQIDLKIVYEFLQDKEEQVTEEETETEDQRKRKRKSLTARLKTVVLSDVSKLALLHSTLSTKQPELAAALLTDSDTNTAQSGSRDLAKDVQEHLAVGKVVKTEDVVFEIRTADDGRGMR